MCEIIPFPLKRRIPITVPAEQPDVRQTFADLVIRRMDRLPEWLIGTVHVCDEDRS